MIIDLEKFINREKPYWEELDSMVENIEREPAWKLSYEKANRLHYLYERAAAALVRVRTSCSDPDMQRYMESLVSRAYGIIYSLNRPRRRFSPVRWFFRTFPQTFRLHIQAFVLSVSITAVGAAFGAVAVAIDSDAKSIVMPFSHLQGDPSERVAKEETAQDDRLEGSKKSFASFLATHNMRVSIFAMALGITWGIGTITMLFYNGVILGAVAVDYVLAGETTFLMGWLLPHGAIEIPAILIAGQAGLVLASALIGRGSRDRLKARLRTVLPNLVTLMFGVGVLLVWAGGVESFFSQYHEPILPYWLKISFGFVELLLLVLFLGFSGRKEQVAAPVTE